MKVYLIRHGDAVSSDVDPERPLSDQGRADVGKIASFVRNLGIRVENIWHSGKTRAAQTAEILSEAVTAAKGCTACDGLGPNANASNIAEELEAHDEDLMIAGHLPFLDNLTSLLAAGKETADIVHLSAGAIACLNRTDPGIWQVDWLLTPEILP